MPRHVWGVCRAVRRRRELLSESARRVLNDADCLKAEVSLAFVHGVF